MKPGGRLNALEDTVTIGKSYGERSLNNEPIDPEELYRQNTDLLRMIAQQKFNVPEEAATELIRDVFLQFLTSGRQIADSRAWLVGAICNACRHYWRAADPKKVPEELREHSTPEPAPLADEIAGRMLLRQALDHLSGREREILWLHHFEGRSVSEIARELSMTAKYAQKLIDQAMKRARAINDELAAGGTSKAQ